VQPGSGEFGSREGTMYGGESSTTRKEKGEIKREIAEKPSQNLKTKKKEAKETEEKHLSSWCT